MIASKLGLVAGLFLAASYSPRKEEGAAAGLEIEPVAISSFIPNTGDVHRASWIATIEQ